MRNLEQLNDRFGIADVVRFETGEGGLPRLVVASPGGEAHVYLHGAHLVHYQPTDGQPVLYLSGQSFFEAGKAIRGGVPVIFPWFGPRNGSGAMHGIVRTRAWEVQSVQLRDEVVSAVFGLASDDATRQIWPHDFLLRYALSIGRELTAELSVTNASQGAFAFEEALHTYYAVGDVRKVSLSGLSGTEFIDKNLGAERRVDNEKPLVLKGPTDRVYLDTTATCVIDDPTLGRRIVVEKANSSSTVVWNPWSERVGSLPDVPPDAWSRFLCVETCNVKDNALSLAAGQTHSTRMMIRAVQE